MLTLMLGAALLSAPLGHPGQQGKQGSMAGMDMPEDGGMSNMGPSMAAMAGHMYMTPLRPKQLGATDMSSRTRSSSSRSITS